MAKKKSTKGYERELRKMVELRKGSLDTWLLPQLRATAQCMTMIDRVFDELMEDQDMVIIANGSAGQQKQIVNPLIPYYDKLQRTLIMQLEALGLNYSAQPDKVEKARSAGDEDTDPMVKYMKTMQGHDR